ncbi:MAG: GspE/PulE family protein [bacterium]
MEDITKVIDQIEPEFLIDYIIENAIAKRASDIHLDPGKKIFNVRYRIDGILHHELALPKDLRSHVISRLKVLSQIDITEFRLPKDGHFEFESKAKGQTYNLRISTFPTAHGEALALRVLNREDVVMKIEDLGFTPTQLEDVKKLIYRPNGLILITGPTGSGKTSLLYSFLNSCNKVEKNIVTIEDPVEFEIEGIRQLQINQDIGLDFSKAIKYVLRQDPDIIMVGEIRDAETAQITSQSSLSGMLIFSTFHTFDIRGVVSRMMEMEVPRSVIAYGIAGVVSSRLVRKVCDACAEPYRPTEEEKSLMPHVTNYNNFRKGAGCDKCHKTGYIGRVGIYEILNFDEEIRSTILDKPNSSLLEIFKEKQKRTLWDAGLEKVVAGITTLDEVKRVANA